MTSEREQELDAKLTNIHKRIAWIADTEARAAWVRGYGANGEFFNEKMRLIAETDKILDELSKPYTP